MAVNILGISGSPHEGGNTDFALRHALKACRKAGARTRRVSLAGRTIHPCAGCWTCAGTGACRFDDDMKDVYRGMKWCHGLLLASPVYLGMVTGQLKVMMDRSVPLRVADFVMRGKVGAGIACGGFRNGGQELTLQSMHTFFLQQDMYAIADGPGYSHSGAGIVGRAETDDIGLRTVENMARRVARAVTRLRGH